MVKKCKWFAGFLSLLLISGLAWADTKTEELIKDIESKVSAITSYRADIVMKMEMMGQTMSHEGKMSYKKPDMIRLEMKMDKPMPMTTITVSDGNISYQYMPEMKMVQKVNLKEIGDLPSADGQNSCDLSKPFNGVVKDTIKYAGEEELDGKKTSVLEGKPITSPGVEIPFQKFKLWIGIEDGVLRKMAGFNGDGKEVMSQELKNIELNPVFAEDTFRFTPPEGVQVLDMTESIKSMLESMKAKPSEK